MNGYVKWLGLSLLILAFSASAGIGQAQRLENRESNQQKPIEQERKSGTPSPSEDEARTEEHGAAVKSDGKVTPSERKSNKESNRMGKKIERERQSPQTAPPALHNNGSLPADPD